MPDRTAANRDEIDRAIEALTPGELLKLKHFSAWRIRGLGRASRGRTGEDLLGEASLTLLQGATNNGSGRRWKRNVDLITHLTGAMRSISSHWKRDFDEQEPALESEIAMRTEEGHPASPLDNTVSPAPSQEREVEARQRWGLIVTRCHRDPAATQVLEGLSRGLTASAMMNACKITRQEYQQAIARIRRRVRDIDLERRRGL